MYICLECGHLFEHHKKFEGKQLEHFGTPCRERWQGCPSCSSGGTTKTFRCEACESYTTEDYYEVEDMRVCENCYIKKTLDGGL